MQLNQATDYAFRVILHLAAAPPGEIVNGQTLAQEQNIPQGFLQKIMRALTGGGLVKSYRGIDGGFQLTKAPEDISLLDVIAVMEGDLNIHRCLGDRTTCSRGCDHICPVHEAIATIQQDFVKALGAVKFAQLAEKYQAEREVKK